MFFGGRTIPTLLSLNSLCGISSNATGFITLPPFVEKLLSPLNSLCGISSNATLGIPMSGYNRDYLSIPFVGFLRMQPRNNFKKLIASKQNTALNSLCGISSNATEITATIPEEGIRIGSQFPLWDFFECNIVVALVMKRSWTGICSQFPLWDFFECNSLYRRVFDNYGKKISQFPLWDFFECNTRAVEVTFRVDQTGSLNSLCGISSNATL